MAKPWSQEFEQHDYDFESIEKELLEEKVVPHISVRHFTELDENGFPRIVSLYNGKRVEEFTVEDQIALSIDEDIRTYGKVRLELEEIISAQGYKYSFEGGRIIVSPIEREEEIYLRLPNLEREEFLSLTKQLKENGAKFNPNLKKWYLPQGVDKSKFQEYISVSDGEKEQLQDRLKVKLTGLPVSDEMQEILSTADVEAEKKQIAKEINQTKKYEANRPLVEKIYSLNMIMDKKHSVADLANVFKNGAYKDNPDADKLIKDIGKEFIRQEQVRAVAR